MRKSAWCGILMVAVGMVLAGAGSVAGWGQGKVPDTPAGHALGDWLEAFNSGDKGKLAAYVAKWGGPQSAEEMAGFRQQTGGFDLISVGASEPMRVSFQVKERGSETHAIGSMEVEKGEGGKPWKLVNLGLRAMPPGAKVEDVKLDAAMRKQVLDGVESNLNEFYVDAALGTKMIEAVKAHAAKGEYDAIADGDVLARRLTEDLRAVSHDKHLRVEFSPFKMPPMAEKPGPEDEARFHKQMERDNCAFEKVEILPNNVGYVKFNAFLDTDFCAPTVAAAMGFVAHADALIFDLRQNGGGQPDMVALMASYLFDKRTHLIDIYNRKEDSTTQNWTSTYLPGVRMAKQPVFVLVSKETFSGAEEFAFDLQTQKRAVIVGETTGGGAHPVSGHPIGDYFMIGVPFAKSLDPVTKKNWEGVGVEPEVKVKASEALATAERLAVGKVKAGR